MTLTKLRQHPEKQRERFPEPDQTLKIEVLHVHQRSDDAQNTQDSSHPRA